ncbi:MAG TPA: succinate dehydrogenase, hydrophobic membrane anchor protein [Caulobacteraceae bacterium]|nr:succinate dehydrogenase, hydrophobic membrane anchor protein [Caulobacteraceae bacterium]
MDGFRTPLGRARGLGSAKDGVGRFISERVTSVALVFLVIWGVRSALELSRTGYAGAVHWLGLPVNAALMVLLAVAGFLHMQTGMAVIVEDYIEKPTTKAALLLLNAFVCWGGLALTVVCLLKVALSVGGA